MFRIQLSSCLTAALVATCVHSSSVIAQSDKLNSAGKKMEADYKAQIKNLKAELTRKLSSFDAADINAYEKARDAEIKARKVFETYNSGIKGGVKKAEGMVSHAKNKWIRGAEHNIRRVEKDLKKAKNTSQRKKLQAELAKWQKNKQDGLEALAERQKALEFAKKAKTDGPRLIKQATAALAKAQANTAKVLKQTGLNEVLMGGALDGKLAKYVILQEATPTALALFAQKDRAHMALVKQLLANDDLMVQMLVNDGAERARVGRSQGPAQYGPAMKIYSDILKASAKAKTGVLHELALAVALEHSVPNKLRAAVADTEAPEFVNPVNRYLTYEKAYTAGELDPAFKNFNAWELRRVVNGEEPDELIKWGRSMMRNFRPEQTRGDYGWRYVRIVVSDVKYGSQNVPLDRPELQFFQNIIMNGGVCGRRAFFGRFTLRAFGIPTIARPSRGHAALAHWTPKGWVVNLGPGWGGGFLKGIYKNGRDFVATSQARTQRSAYLAVKRAQWIGDVSGEPRVYGIHGGGKPEFWNAMSLHLQERIITQSNAKTLGALGTNLGEADGSSVNNNPNASSENQKEKISVGSNGSITIPAAAFTAANRSQVQISKSHGTGMQIFLPRFSAAGLTLLRGGTWKSSAVDCGSGARLISSGYGRYDNWGLRAAITAPAGKAKLPRELNLDLGDGVSMQFVYIKPGTFTMGGERAKPSKWIGADQPKHKVTISKGFYLGKYEVTQEQYEHITGKNPSSRKHRDPKYPVDTISETDAERFCAALAGKTGTEARLPTEAEWEYAARAGSSRQWFFGSKSDKLSDYAWFKDNSGLKSHPVGQKKPNPWGLYDMYGNVCERVADRYDISFYKKSPKVDPIATGVTKTSSTKYEVSAKKAGNYALSSKVCTLGYGQHLMVSVNGGEAINIDLPYTSGEWGKSSAVNVKLRKGANVLEFHRIDAPQSGIAVKAHYLTAQ